jgi:predicted GNAT superfamily acetyltransferase
MADIIIRAMTASDIEVVWAINQENVPAVGEETREDLAKIHEQSTIALVAEASKQVVGFCMVLLPGAEYGSPNYEFFCERLDDFIYLDRVAVTSDFQGRGIGAALYIEVEKLSDATWFALEVNTKPRNEGSLRFHAREGFVQMEEFETRPGKMVSLMVKKLKG